MSLYEVNTLNYNIFYSLNMKTLNLKNKRNVRRSNK